MELIKDLILQLVFILIPISLYHSLWLSKQIHTQPQLNKPLILSLNLLSTILCLIYPIHIDHEIPITLLSVPLMVSFFYGGYVIGISVLLFITLYSFIFIEHNSLAHIFITLSYSAILMIVSKRWNKIRRRFRFLAGVFTGCCYVILLYISERLLNDAYAFFLVEDKLIVSSIFIVISSILTISIIEYMMENLKLRIQLIQTEKLSVVSELAASVAHEVRNPLTVVRGFIQLLENNRDKKQQEYTTLILSELDRAQEIITDYLNLAKQQYIQKQQLNISKLISEVCNLMVSYANFKNINIESNIPSSLFAYGDEYKLKQVFINLIKNAIEAVSDDTGTVTVQVYESKEYIRIKITDNGVGMSNEQIQHLGEPFYTLKEKGTGLGLTVTFSIIELHNGSIQFQSSMNKGTSVRVSIPKWNKSKEQNR